MKLERILGIDPRMIERGEFMGRPVALLDRNDLLVVIGWFARQSNSIPTGATLSAQHKQVIREAAILLGPSNSDGVGQSDGPRRA